MGKPRDEINKSPFALQEEQCVKQAAGVPIHAGTSRYAVLGGIAGMCSSGKNAIAPRKANKMQLGFNVAA